MRHFLLFLLLLTGCQTQIQPTPPPAVPTPTRTPPPAPPSLAWNRRDTGIPSYTFVTAFVADAQGWWIGAYDEIGVWHSPDNGTTWQAVVGIPAPVFAMAQTDSTRWVAASGGLWRGDGTGWQLQTGLPDSEVLDVTADGNVLYAVMGLEGLFRVANGVVSNVETPSETTRAHTGTLSIAAKGKWLILGTSGAGAWQSLDAGQTWELLTFDERAFAANVVIQDDQRAWVQTRNGLWHSADRGATWQKWSDAQFTALLPSDEGLLVGTKTGVIQRSADGRIWQSLGQGLNPRLPIVTIATDKTGALVTGLQDGLWRLEDSKWNRKVGAGTTRIDSVAQLPDGTLLAGHRDGVYWWGDNRWQLAPIGGATASVLVPDPHNPNAIYAGTDGLGVWHSNDKGSTWVRLQAGADISLITGIYPDPTIPNKIVAQVAYDRLYEWESTVEGWHPIWEGIHIESEVFDLMPSPTHPKQWWAGTSDGMVVRDAGSTTWRYGATDLGDQSVLTLYEDTEGIWLGTTRGLYYVNTRIGQLEGKSERVPEIGINHIAILPNGQWLFGTPLQGVYSLMKDQWQPEPIKGTAVTQILQEDNDVWVATNEGLWQATVSQMGTTIKPLRLLPMMPTPASLPSPVPRSSDAPKLPLYAHLLNPTDELFRTAAKNGFSGVVMLMPWREIEPNPDEWHWERTDTWMYAAQYYGLEVVIRLDQSPLWATANPTDTFASTLNPLPTNWADYTDYARHVATRYQGQVKGYVLWNEPNLAIDWGGTPPDPQGYVELLQATVPALRAADPNARIVAGALAPTTRNDATAMDDIRYLEAMLETGASEYFDVFGVHPYPFGLPPTAAPDSNGGLNLARLGQIQAVLARYGLQERPIWVTEFGYSVAASPFGVAVTAEQRGNYLREAINRFPRDYPQVELLTLWNLASNLNPTDEKAGYNLLQDEAVLSVVRSLGASHSDPVYAPPPIALAADVKVHLGDSELPPPWWPLFGGQNPSLGWEGGFYLTEAPTTTRTLLFEIYQPNELGNRLSVNGIPLHEKPLPVADFRSQWLTMQMEIPAEILTAGWNQITFEVGHIVPNFQQRRYVWDDLQLRNMRLVP